MIRSDYTILGTVVSEKAYSLNEKNVYVLKVKKSATKSDICLALKTIFNVDVVAINTLITRGKIRRKTISKKSAPIYVKLPNVKYVKLPNVKKAIVRLKTGQSLPVSTLQKSEAKI